MSYRTKYHQNQLGPARRVPSSRLAARRLQKEEMVRPRLLESSGLLSSRILTGSGVLLPSLALLDMVLSAKCGLSGSGLSMECIFVGEGVFLSHSCRLLLLGLDSRVISWLLSTLSDGPKGSSKSIVGNEGNDGGMLLGNVEVIEGEKYASGGGRVGPWL